jgi:hypothetical protein
MPFFYSNKISVWQNHINDNYSFYGIAVVI